MSDNKGALVFAIICIFHFKKKSENEAANVLATCLSNQITS